MEKKMESRLANLDNFALEAIKEAGLNDHNATVTKEAHVFVETGTGISYCFKVWGLDALGNAKIYHAVPANEDNLCVVVSDYGSKNKVSCFTFKDVVNALKKLVVEEPAPIEIPF